MERRNLLVGLVTLAFALLMLSGTALAHAAHHKKVKPRTSEPNTCVVYTEPGAFMDQGEFGTSSSVADIVSVECEEVYAEHYVTLSANELYSRCDKKLYWSEAAPFDLSDSQPSFTVRLDNDGNGGAVLWGGPSCAAGESLVAAHLNEAPYTTVTTSFDVLPPRPTEPAVIAEPGPPSFPGAVESEENSSAAAIIEVEFPPVFAEEPVNINAAQLYSRCHKGQLTWAGPEGEVLGYGEELSDLSLDNDGNAFVVALGGESCAAGSSLIEASLENAPYTTYTTDFNILPPQPTFPPAG
ncbi:MAG TPA: hypothetical protein VMI13_11455 [Solirubrobacteraceae bacterium]|nr:hypothetical protein [Solirubrobacteraceae bacterium]